ncbi:Harbinger transposase-derived nuclease domain [Cinara cedri]|uniref:Harbinger transposase-derived nuclease domain n=1 Tax=Cinara cedri TaxID=506608 RepID=A0A5E4NLY5_9HEMI|nr:Harbinger transposase-derived nuclease domain [Cinara cedri]
MYRFETNEYYCTGSCYDQTIFKKSCIYNKLVSGYWKNSLIVADSGYTHLEFVVTPYLNPQNGPEMLYNKSLIRTRNLVEKFYGILKQRFPILSFGSRLNFKIDTAQTMTIACCILYNVACNHYDLKPPELLSIGIGMPVNDDLNLREEHELDEGNARQQLTEEYFSLLI